MRLISFLTGCIDYKQQIVSEIGHHDVVKDPTLLVGQEGIALSARFQANHVARDDLLKSDSGIRDAARSRIERDLSHMRDVEQTGSSARMKMLLEYAQRILNWHLVPSEGHHPRSQLLVQSMQGGCFQVRLVQKWASCLLDDGRCQFSARRANGGFDIVDLALGTIADGWRR